MTKTFTVCGRAIETVVLGQGAMKVLFFHGFGASASGLPADEELLTGKDIQLICCNRPGVGGSSLRKDYSVEEIVADAKAVLDQLKIGNCVVAGWSAGGLFAQAFAQQYAGAVTSLHLVSSALPFADKHARKALPRRWKNIVWMNRFFPLLTKAVFKSVSKKAQKDPAQLLAQSIRDWMPADKDVAADKRFTSLLLQAALEGFAGNGNGVFEEAKALGKLVIDYSRITCPVQIWTGEQDNIWPCSTAGYLQQRLPQAELHIFRSSGHLLYLKEWEKLVAAFALQPV